VRGWGGGRNKQACNERQHCFTCGLPARQSQTLPQAAETMPLPRKPRPKGEEKKDEGDGGKEVEGDGAYRGTCLCFCPAAPPMKLVRQWSARRQMEQTLVQRHGKSCRCGGGDGGRQERKYVGLVLGREGEDARSRSRSWRGHLANKCAVRLLDWCCGCIMCV